MAVEPNETSRDDLKHISGAGNLAPQNWPKVKEAEHVRHQTLKLKEYSCLERVLVANVC
jgi:hypothetical protein